MQKPALIAITSIFLFFSDLSNASAYDGYSAQNCTAVIGKNTVKLDVSIDDSRGICKFTADNQRYVSVKLAGLWNLYDRELKKLVFTKGSVIEPFGIENGKNVLSYTYMKPGGGVSDGVVVVDKRSGSVLTELVFYSINGPYGNDDVYTVTASHDSPLRFIRVTGKNVVKELQVTPCSQCSIWTYDKNTGSIVLSSQITSERFTYNINELKAAPNVKIDEKTKADRRVALCEHLYVGKIFRGKGGILGISQEYKVVGFSKTTSKATIKSTNDEYTQEVSCYQIPE